MSYQLFKDFIVITCWMLAIGFFILHKKQLIELEQKLWRKIKKYARAFIRSVEACIAERKGNMFIILKSPGQAPERRHNVGNSFKAIHKEIDSENPNHIEIIPGIYMCYDTDEFAKSAAPCMADERADKIYYGDVAFYAVNAKDNGLRCLTEREAKTILNYIATYRADKQGV